jgi:ankyrin repeat protein
MVLCIAREEFNTLLRHLAPDCDLEQRHSGGATALLFASYVHEEELILPLIRHGANYNTADDKGHTPLMGLCANEGGDLELVNYFSKLPNINVNAEDSKGRTALHRAAYSSKPSVLEELLNFPTIDVNARTHKGLSAIDYAIDYQQLSNLQILLRNPKCDINTTLYLPASRLYFAIEHNLLSQIKTLLSRPHKDPDIRLSAFNYAIWQQKDAIAAMFLQDMDKQAQHDFIKQALALAWERGQREIGLSLYQTYGTQYGIALPPQEELEEFTYDVAPEFEEWLEMDELLINHYSEE